VRHNKFCIVLEVFDKVVINVLNGKVFCLKGMSFGDDTQGATDSPAWMT